MILGNPITTESLNALGGGQQTGFDENDALEGAEHARQLVDDCRRLLLGANQLPVGAWGLIDNDPNNGDPAETEVDSILLLTDDCYIVAEYDSHLDKFVRYENVPLDNVTLIELGLVQNSKIFQGVAIAHLCIRINYTVDGVDGYFHMFRSPNIRFFNNVAVVIRKPEEITESLTAIIELFRIALENRGRSVPVQCGGSLQRRKSKNMLAPPQGMPRNLSESQLVQMGSKAVSNVVGQFSKIGQTFNKKKSNNKNAVNPQNAYKNAKNGNPVSKTTFHVGGGGMKSKNESSSDSENEVNIYEPDDHELVQENPLYDENMVLPSVGIIMAAGGSSNSNETPTNHLLQDKDCVAKISSDMSTMSISSITDCIGMPHGMLECASPIRSRSPVPEIKIEGNDHVGFGHSNIAGQSSSGGGPPPRNLSANEIKSGGK